MFYLNDKIAYTFQYKALWAAVRTAKSKGDISNTYL